MRIGFTACGLDRRPYYADLGVRDAKTVLSLETGITRDGNECRCFEECGVRPFVDLRFDKSLLREPGIVELYGEFCGAAARACPEVREFSVWDEPNCPVVATGSNSVVYRDLLETAYRQIKAGRPDALVYNGGMSVNGETWNIRDLANAGGLAFTDAIGIHPFMLRAKSVQQLLDSLAQMFDGDPQEQRDGRPSLEQYAMPYVVTEWGIPCALPEAGVRRAHSLIYAGGVELVDYDLQADMMVAGLTELEQRRTTLCLLMLEDQHAGHGPIRHWSHFCGLLEYLEHEDGSFDWRPKPSYYAVKEWIGTHQ